MGPFLHIRYGLQMKKNTGSTEGINTPGRKYVQIRRKNITEVQKNVYNIFLVLNSVIFSPFQASKKNDIYKNV